MSNELQASTTSGLTLYAVLFINGQAWNGSSLEAINGANWTNYDITMTETAAGIYFGDMPAVGAGVYSYNAYSQAGANPATTDTLKGTGFIAWDGSAEIIPSTTAQINTVLSASHGAGAWGCATGSGAKQCIITVDDGVNPLDGAEVWITTDLAGTNIIASGITDGLGRVTVYLDPGTYYLWKQYNGITFTNPETMTVVP